MQWVASWQPQSFFQGELLFRSFSTYWVFLQASLSNLQPISSANLIIIHRTVHLSWSDWLTWRHKPEYQHFTEDITTLLPWFLLLLTYASRKGGVVKVGLCYLYCRCWEPVHNCLGELCHFSEASLRARKGEAWGVVQAPSQLLSRAEHTFHIYFIPSQILLSVLQQNPQILATILHLLYSIQWPFTPLLPYYIPYIYWKVQTMSWNTTLQVIKVMKVIRKLILSYCNCNRAG